MKMSSKVIIGGGAPAFDFDLEGSVDVVPTESTADGSTLYAAVHGASFSSRVPGSQPDFDKVAAQINAIGCFFAFKNGLMTEFRLPPGVAAMVANTYREIGATLQVALSPVGSTDVFTSEEYDTTGQYVAEYRRDANPGIWHKRKVRYLGILADKNSGPSNVAGRVRPEVMASQIIIHVTPTGHPQLVEATNQVIVSGGQAPVDATTQVTLREQLGQGMGQPAPNWPDLVAQTERIFADEAYGHKASIDSLDQARIHGQTFEKIVPRLELLARARQQGPGDGRATTEEDSRLFIGLAAIFRQKPETVAKAVRKINARSPASETLVDALGSASTPATQEALIELASSKIIDPRLATRANSVLLRAKRPSDSSIERLKGVLAENPYDEQALYGLGSYSRRMRDEGRLDEAKSLGQLLVSRLQATHDDSPTIHVLRAITNSGYDGALPYVVPLLSDDRDTVRAAAARSLQSMRDPKVDEILATKIRSDRSGEVRVSAMEGAQVRFPTNVLVEAAVASTSADDRRVRYQAVELLIRWLPQRPEVGSVLSRVAESDQEGNVRERARGAL